MPKPLPIEGEIGSFEALVKSLSRDINGTTMLREMLRTGAAKRERRGKAGKMVVSLTARAAEPDEDDISRLAESIHDVSAGLCGAWETILDRESGGFNLQRMAIDIRPEHEASWLPLLDDAVRRGAEGIAPYIKAYGDLYGARAEDDDSRAKWKSYSIGAFYYRQE